MATDVPFDVTMDCTKCKKALCDRVQQKFWDELLGTDGPIWKEKVYHILKHVIEEELAK